MGLSDGTATFWLSDARSRKSCARSPFMGVRTQSASSIGLTQSDVSCLLFKPGSIRNYPLTVQSVRKLICSSSVHKRSPFTAVMPVLVNGLEVQAGCSCSVSLVQLSSTGVLGTNNTDGFHCDNKNISFCDSLSVSGHIDVSFVDCLPCVWY
jgi:hypothetical protein